MSEPRHIPSPFFDNCLLVIAAACAVGLLLASAVYLIETVTS
jgi:hypothetical protein